MDLLDFYRGTLSARRLWVLIKQLPDSSRLWRAMSPDAARWQVEHLVADLIDTTIAAHGGKSRVERPGQRVAEDARRREQSRRYRERSAARAKRRGEAAT